MQKANSFAVVLGGMASENMHNGLPRFAKSADRLWQGLYLLKQGYVDTLLISGGLGRLFDKQIPEGELLDNYLTAIGLKDKTIIIESSSRNTFENARNTAKLFDRKKLPKKIILITSAFHMPRARACFEKQGFDLEAFPADPLSDTRPMQWKDYLIPSGSVLAQWNVLIREWAGMVMYKINGYI
ncbi:YdcF family protein [Marinilabilia rubra]|uniref:YdcF family protein n=1 Tax=Marinilabilia rubra TaxID=2162893 RepID=UPI001E37F1FC|nr:YdcF family protein [Marinilabilia rubra]